MGGKPWQSMGCFNCKKRKKKCDKQEPECQRCLERGVQCQGYPMNIIFFHQNAQTQSEKRKKKATSLKETEYLSRAQPLILRNGPSKREQIISSYITAYFPADVKGSTDIDPWYNLLAGISKLPSKPMMLEKALAAKACIWLSKTNQTDRSSDDMYRYGLQLYNDAIGHMSHQLNRKRKLYIDELIYTVALFQGLVSCHCPQGLGVWLDQMTVTNGILKQYYRQKSDNPLVQSIYLGFHRTRLLQSLSPIQSKAPVDMAVEDFPYHIPPDAYRPFDELFEIMSEMAPFLAAIQKINLFSHENRQRLLFDCLAHRELLVAWYAKQVENIGGLPWIGTSLSKLPPAEHLFGTSYCFSSLDCGRLHVLYWAALSIMQGVIGQAWCYVHYSSASSLGVFNNPEYQLSKFYADEISRALPYCLQDSHRAWGSNITIFSLGQIAKVYLEFQCREELMWSQEVFKLMGSRGYDFPGHFSHLINYVWMASEASSSTSSSSQSSPLKNQETPSPA